MIMRPGLLAGRSVAFRVRVVIMATVTSTLVIGYLALLLYDRSQARADLVSETDTLCGIIADRAAYALAFRDAAAARENLAVLASHQSVVAAAIFDDAGAVFAGYSRDGGPVAFPAPHDWSARAVFRDGALWALRDIHASGEKVGYAALRIGQDALKRRTRTLTAIVLTVLAGSILLAFGVAGSMQRIIVSPIQNLVDVALRISRSERTSGERAQRSGVAELDALADAFNAMLRQLEQRDEILRQTNQELEARVTERTLELSAAKEEAERANLAKSTFLSNMSHELRTPLNAVLGFSRLLRDAPDVTPQQAECLAIVVTSGEKLLKMINDVLEIARIEAGRSVVEETRVDLYETLQETKALLYLRAAEKGLSLSVEIGPELPRHVVADGRKLGQVLLNLVENAIKYTVTGGVQLRALVARRPSAEWVRLRFEVEDTGPGISEADRERVFLPFVRLAEHQAESGTGLGLALCKEYVSLLGGTLAVASRLGHGTRFHFELPVVVDESAAAPAAQRTVRRTRLAAGQRRYRVLIAEDHAESRELLIRMLSPLDFMVQAVGTGEQAVAAFRDFRPDVIFMDVRMPSLNGIEATRAIRAVHTERVDRKVVIIAVSAHALEEETQQILAAGVDGVIHKPYSEVEVLDALATHLGVRFEVETPSGGAEESVGGAVDAASFDRSLDRLPRAIVEDLRTAVGLLDVHATLAVLERVDPLDRPLAAGLRAMIDSLQFRELLDLLEGRSRGSPLPPSSSLGGQSSGPVESS